MEQRLVDKIALSELVAQMAAGQRVLAPGQWREQVVFAPVTAERGLAEDFGNTKNAPKAAFFPHTETLVRYQRTAQGPEAEAEELAEEDTLALVRPCDARSFHLLDRIFDQEGYRDPYYLARRERTTVVSLACRQVPYAACFCTSVGGAPVPEDGGGADAVVIELESQYLVEGHTAKGQALLERLTGARPADAAAAEEKAALAQSAREQVGSQVPAAAAEQALGETFDHPYWESLHRKCLACGTCTYLCPTCHCFDIRDEEQKDAGIRLRNWDSCMYPLFTLETSGHNPRPSQKERWRQRVMHKFRYLPQNYQQVGCVGCGRCVLACPVNLDIRTIVTDVAALPAPAAS